VLHLNDRQEPAPCVSGCDRRSGKEAFVVKLHKSALVLRPAFGVAAVLGLMNGAALAQTLDGALARAYEASPTLNSQRASLRATNEGVPQAIGGYRPRVTGTAEAGRQYSENSTRITGAQNRAESNGFSSPRGLGLSVNQTVYNFGKTDATVGQAESQVLGARATLRNTEQNVLFEAATAYMNVLRDTAVLNLQNNNVEVLEEQLRQVRDRFQVGEVTRTDVAQAEARLQGSRAQRSVAQANLKTSLARYRQQVGAEPKKLAPAKPIEHRLPKTLNAAMGKAMASHPSIIAAQYGVDAAELAVKVTEADLYPTLGVTGSVSHRYDTATPGDVRTSASVVGTLTVPLYEGGIVYSRTRQAKETAGQRRIDVDTQRDLVRANIVVAWGALEGAKAQIQAAQAQVQAAEIALNGVREEAKVGQRTTLDVLNAQQELLTARNTLITAQRDRVVASYSVLSAAGDLSARTLSLKVASHNDRAHYDQVRDKWWGLQTPDGR
jgi:outer membrane protein